jgi:signal transduction histidine kinase
MTPILGADGRISHTVSVGADITARVEAERRKTELQQRLHDEMKERERLSVELQLAQKLESVGRLAAGVAHEINTPIQYVGDSVHFLRTAMEDIQRVLVAYQDATQALLADPVASAALAPAQAAAAAADLEFLNAEIPKAFERTLNGVDRVAGIVRAMKEFAHPDATQHGLADLNHALETTLTVARNEYKYSATVETHFGELPQVLCNVGELNQVFLNLIVNAVHAIQESGKDSASGHITVTTRVAGENVHITVADNGRGIPPEIIEKIYDPFFTTKEVGKGTGQGLAIARSIVVDKHGGDIGVRSRVGEGAAFTITLPIAGRPTPAGK